MLASRWSLLLNFYIVVFELNYSASVPPKSQTLLNLPFTTYTNYDDGSHDTAIKTPFDLGSVGFQVNYDNKVKSNQYYYTQLQPTNTIDNLEGCKQSTESALDQPLSNNHYYKSPGFLFLPQIPSGFNFKVHLGQLGLTQGHQRTYNCHHRYHHGYGFEHQYPPSTYDYYPSQSYPQQPYPPFYPSQWYPESPSYQPKPQQPAYPQEPKPQKPAYPQEPKPQQPTYPQEPKPQQPTYPQEPKPQQPTYPQEPKPQQPVYPQEPKPQQPTYPLEQKPQQSTYPQEPRPQQPTYPQEPKPQQPSYPQEPQLQQPTYPQEQEPQPLDAEQPVSQAPTYSEQPLPEQQQPVNTPETSKMPEVNPTINNVPTNQEQPDANINQTMNQIFGSDKETNYGDNGGSQTSMSDPSANDSGTGKAQITPNREESGTDSIDIRFGDMSSSSGRKPTRSKNY